MKGHSEIPGGNPEYHRAKVWQIGFFALNNTAVNLYYMMMLYISYYAAGVIGLSVALVSALLMGLNILDGITDPIVGWIMDKTDGRFGKFRPFMVIGNLILAADAGLMYLCQFTGAAKLPFLIVCFVIYDVGYTFQFDVTRAAQSALTNDPKQRPVFSAFDMILNVILYVGVSMLVSNFLIVKHGDFNAAMFSEFFLIIVPASAGCTALAVVGIWGKDRKEYFGIQSRQPKIRFRDCFDVIIHNRNVQMLMISAGTDKLFSNITTNATVTVILFGIVCGDYALSGQLNLYVFGPSLAVSLFCVRYARKRGQKRALLFAAYGAMAANLAIFFLFVLGDPKTMSFQAWGYFTVLFLAAMAFRGGFMSVGNSMIVPMIADCADYEVYRSGKYILGMIGGLFSFVDKIVTSLNSVIVGTLVISIGFKDMFPTADTPFSTTLFVIAMICFCGLPMAGWIATVIAMRFYNLDSAKMAEIGKYIADAKAGENAEPR
jgi:Na+/melibiose symporter-like transporter